MKIKNDGQTAYQCLCRERAQAFLEAAKQQGFDFLNDEFRLRGTLYWDEYKEHTCFVVTKGDTIFVYHERQAKEKGFTINYF